MKPLPHTKAALEVYAHKETLLDQQLRAAQTHSDVDAWDEARRQAVREVQDAFYQDCCEQDIPNSKAHCRIADLVTLRRWVVGGDIDQKFLAEYEAEQARRKA